MLSVLLSVLLAVSPALAADGQTAGEVKALVPAAARNDRALNVKDALAWNDLLRTDAKGRLRAGLTDGSILSLGSNSELRVVQHDAASQQTSLEMNYGKMRNQVVKITQPNGKYEVKTANAVIGVIGTDFFVGFENNQTTVICYVGTVVVTPLAGAKVVKSDSGNAGASNSVTLVAGQMVVIGMEIPPGGYQPSSTPRDTAKNGMQDTNVPNQPPALAKAPSHHLRNVVLVSGMAAAGWAIGIWQLKTDSPAPGCANNPKCR
jgi:ferric-dicitrate binding protein FerR (iron transport regulator)